MRLQILAFCLILGGCNIGKTDWQSLKSAQKEQVAAGLAKKCGLPAESIKPVGANEIYVAPAQNGNVKAVECALAGLDQYYGYDWGFPGNEAHSGNRSDAE